MRIEEQKELALSTLEKDAIVYAKLRNIGKGKRFPCRLKKRYGSNIEELALHVLVECEMAVWTDRGYVLTNKGRTRLKDGYVYPEAHEKRIEKIDKMISIAIALVALFISLRK